MTRQVYPKEHLQGFTFLEMIIVVAIIGLMASFAIPRISSFFQLSLNSAAREVASVVRETYHSAVLTKRVHRVVYKLKDNTYWVESAPQDVLLDTAQSKEDRERRSRLLKSKPKDDAGFVMEKSITSKPKELPSGIAYESLETEQSREPIKDGIAYTHFFPHGLTEQTVIHLQDTSEHKATLVISAVLGRTDVYDRFVSSEEIFGKR